ncbi:2'-carboxy-2,3-dihydroxybiphenyl 1,2-dioxygenase small subunit and ferredoxin fusion protein [Pseudonocardia ammonioxydans]|uniref:2'-carboxy-2,3-dihydroxybiphenyl 1,2-dioxygenase small subunit and ferredoxin fusion protein n=1 Tax=Pseudonocardia ammonioxydans TaxID=260086 RepID=A0A1I5IYY1_PSUAM|nr:ferredoxin [Pseudonocardia ammonioxydans]SFO65351.1 2'-carboxy-2,3-dihydroxybiphenyl 1,2-dioxygenase small subunit and ferredoxin fusion protein [Pseudonocardia ammonioxydans]
MKVVLDVAKCEGFASCVLSAPEVFDLDEEDNIAIVLEAEPPARLRSALEAAVLACPVRAITLTA